MSTPWEIWGHTVLSRLNCPALATLEKLSLLLEIQLLDFWVSLYYFDMDKIELFSKYMIFS